MRPGPLLAALLAVACAACGDSPPEAPSPGDGGVITIRGNERLGWDQQAASAAELATLRFAIYVDDARRELSGATCENSPQPSGFPCSGPLPSMTPGPHTLQLAAYFLDGSRVVESPKSAPLQVNVSPALAAPGDSATAPAPESPPAAPPPAADRFEPLLPGLTFRDIGSFAVTDDGWLLVAERAGVLHAVPLDAPDAASSIAIAGTAAAGGPGLLVDIAVDPEFQRTRVIYVLQTAPARDGLTWQLARYRQAGTVFGERAVLLETGEPATDPRGLVEFGPDGRVYMAFGDARRRRRGARADERESVVLRLNPDGTTPPDQVSANPLYALVRGEPRAWDWSPHTGILWMALDAAGAGARLVSLPADVRRARAGLFDDEAALPSAGTLSSIAFYRGDLPSWRNSLLMAGENGLHRAGFDPATGGIASIDVVTETAVRAVATTAGGEILIATADAVLRARADAVR